MKSIKNGMFEKSRISNIQTIVGGAIFTTDGGDCDTHNGNTKSSWCDDITVTSCNDDYNKIKSRETLSVAISAISTISSRY